MLLAVISAGIVGFCSTLSRRNVGVSASTAERRWRCRNGLEPDDFVAVQIVNYGTNYKNSAIEIYGKGPMVFSNISATPTKWKNTYFYEDKVKKVTIINYKRYGKSTKSAIESIQNDAFRSCPNLEEVNLANTDNLRFIGESAFYECTKLREVVLPDTVIDIRAAAFHKCTTLSNLTFVGNNPSGAIYFGQSAFEDSIITSLELKANEVIFGLYCFKNTSLVNVSVTRTDSETFNITEWNACLSERRTNLTIAEELLKNATGKKWKKELTGYYDHYKDEYPEAVEVINDTMINKEQDVGKIMNGAFSTCASLQNIRFETLTSIATDAFGGCDSMKSFIYCGDSLNGDINVTVTVRVISHDINVFPNKIVDAFDECRKTPFQPNTRSFQPNTPRLYIRLIVHVGMFLDFYDP